MQNNIGIICRKQMWEMLGRNGFMVDEMDIKISKQEPFHLFVFVSNEQTRKLILYPTEIFEHIVQENGFICVQFEYRYLCSLIQVEKVSIETLYNLCWSEEELFSAEYQLLSMLYGIILHYEKNPTQSVVAEQDDLCSWLWKMCTCGLYHANAQPKYRKKICNEFIELYHKDFFFAEKAVSNDIYDFSICLFFLLYCLIKA